MPSLGPLAKGLGFGVGFGVWGLKFRVWVSAGELHRFRVEGLAFKAF